MQVHRIDRDGCAPILEGYTLVTTQVEFLKSATEGILLHIRDPRVCDWAETFFTARQIKYQVTGSYIQELQSFLPSISLADIKDLVQLLGSKLDTLDRPLSVQMLLNAIYPHTIWHESPTLQHLAEWLVWFAETNVPTEVKPLIAIHARQWQREDLSFDSRYYGIQTQEEAQSAIKSWLGISNRLEFPISQEFPINVPLAFLEMARQTWRDEIIQTQGARFSQIEKLKIPFSLKKIAAEELFDYLLHNRADLTLERVESLVPYLKGKQISSLREILPPAQPSAMPQEPNGVINWFIKEYLPYREWQRTSGSDESQKIAMHAAREFELWYLEHYPKGINGGTLHSWLSFNRVNKIDFPDNSNTLVIILDGMHVPDSRLLIQNVLMQTQRLSIVVNDYAFAPIPTVTKFAKEALLKGVPPSHAESLNPIGQIVPDRQSPGLHLRDAVRGKVYFWRVSEPDATYHHKNTSENLLHDVEGRLEAEALKIKEIVESIPDDVILQIIITTDHGRLLSEAQRTIPVPANMESHGRAAWGVSPYPFDSSYYQIKEDIAYLQGASYGMTSDIAIPLDEVAFKNNNNHSGSEVFPHGGIFPEEVVIPWIVLVRDQVQPDASITIKGGGRARRDGSFSITTVNKSDIEMKLETVTLALKGGKVIQLSSDQKVPPRSKQSVEIAYSPWPSPIEVESATGNVQVRLPNGVKYEYLADIDIQSEDIYVRPKDNALEDLD